MTTSSLRDAAAAGAAVIRRAVDDGALPGAAFAVGHADHGVVLVDVCGAADAHTGRAVTTTTPFCLASTTKPMATTVLAAIREQGLLDLGDPITTLVPELPAPLWTDRAPTVREVASHTAGLGTHHRFFYTDERAPIDVAEAVRTLARPTLPIGGQWRYSNLGYGVLQLAMERATGNTMDELVHRHVFRPLGMRHSAWGGASGPDGAAVRHLSPTEAYPGYVTDHPPASEAWCSIDDLLTFGLAHARSSLLSASSHQLLAEPWAPRQTDGAAYALGWVTREYAGARILVHGGRMGGVGAHLTVVPALGLVVAALANIETEVLATAVATVLEATVPQYAPPSDAPPWEVGAAHTSMVGRWEGVAQLADDTLPVVLDTAGPRITLRVADAVTEVVMPHVQPEAVLGHAMVVVPHPLVPAGSICHLDALPVNLVDGHPTPPSPGERADLIVGSLVSAQYPNPDRRRQGDAVSAALRLTRVD